MSSVHGSSKKIARYHKLLQGSSKKHPKAQLVACILWNPQSLCNKVEFLISKMQDNNIDFALITESWLKSQKNYITFLLKEAGFNICHFNRDSKAGGGVAIISNCKFISKFQKNGQFSSFEVTIQTFVVKNSSNLTFIVIYRHFAENLTSFLDEFHEFIEYINLKFKNVIIAGDFNIHVNEEN